MAPAFGNKINVKNATFLRVGIKWDPLERDHLGDSFALEVSSAPEKELEMLNVELRRLWWIRKFLVGTYFLRNYGRSLGKRVDQAQNRMNILKKYVAQIGHDSHDLDLCCCCYDQNRGFTKFVSPRTTESRDNLRGPMAFMHSGDDDTGTGDLFDETINVDMANIDPAIHHVFFVMVSINHGFHEVKGCSWSIISTRDENELMGATTNTQTSHQIHMMAKLTREPQGWVLTELADYSPLEIDGKKTLGDKLNELIKRQYLALSPAVPEE